jgi:hypothetical protein
MRGSHIPGSLRFTPTALGLVSWGRRGTGRVRGRRGADRELSRRGAHAPCREVSNPGSGGSARARVDRCTIQVVSSEFDTSAGQRPICALGASAHCSAWGTEPRRRAGNPCSPSYGPLPIDGVFVVWLWALAHRARPRGFSPLPRVPRADDKRPGAHQSPAPFGRADRADRALQRGSRQTAAHSGAAPDCSATTPAITSTRPPTCTQDSDSPRNAAPISATSDTPTADQMP